ncbi:MAG: hypothetical protein ABFD63_14990, partial [Smithella sp.]
KEYIYIPPSKRTRFPSKKTRYDSFIRKWKKMHFRFNRELYGKKMVSTPPSASELRSSAKEIGLLVRVDGWDWKTEIRPCLKWAVQDSFWGPNLRSLASIRRKGRNGCKKFDNIYSAFKRVNTSSSKEQAEVKGEQGWEKEKHQLGKALRIPSPSIPNRAMSNIERQFKEWSRQYKKKYGRLQDGPTPFKEWKRFIGFIDTKLDQMRGMGMVPGLKAVQPGSYIWKSFAETEASFWDVKGLK